MKNSCAIVGLVLLVLNVSGTIAAIGQAPTQVPLVYVEPSSGLYHAFSCKRHPQTSAIDIEKAISQGRKPCPDCHPENMADVEGFLKAAGFSPSDLVSSAETAKKAVSASVTAFFTARDNAPFKRPTAAELRTIAKDAATVAAGDKEKFVEEFRSRVRKLNPHYEEPVQMIYGGGVAIFAPVGVFEQVAAERVRKMEPLGLLSLRTSIEILVSPSQIDSQDIERIVVTRNGVIVSPLSSTLAPKTFTTRLGAKTVLHAGSVYYPLTAFAPGVGVKVTVTGIARFGDNATRTFDALELRSIY